MIQYILVRSKRKTVAIYITKKAIVEVRAPLHMPKPDIDRFVQSKQQWISEHLSICSERNLQKAAFKLTYNDTVLLCGVRYPIRVKAGIKAGFDGDCFFMPQSLSPTEIKYTVIQIYKQVAKKILTTRTVHYSALMGVTPAAIKVNSAKTHWGSCSEENSINFSWRLILAKDDVIDYVVVHELAHICQHNHSERFWKIVQSVIPDYQVKQQELKRLQEQLSKEDWDWIIRLPVKPYRCLC